MPTKDLITKASFTDIAGRMLMGDPVDPMDPFFHFSQSEVSFYDRLNVIRSFNVANDVLIVHLRAGHYDHRWEDPSDVHVLVGEIIDAKDWIDNLRVDVPRPTGVRHTEDGPVATGIKMDLIKGVGAAMTGRVDHEVAGKYLDLSESIMKLLALLNE